MKKDKVDHVRANVRAVREMSRANARAREEEKMRGERGEGARRRRGETTTTTTSEKVSSQNAEARRRFLERDLNEARDAGARRRRASDARVDARFASPKHGSYGETPAYLLRRKSTLLREMNEDMERALREIEHRRLERELERENARAASALEREERRRREAALRARAKIDAEKPTALERSKRREALARVRDDFARARIRVDDERFDRRL